jgi:hypothetical protein
MNKRKESDIILGSSRETDNEVLLDKEFSYLLKIIGRDKKYERILYNQS